MTNLVARLPGAGPAVRGLRSLLTGSPEREPLPRGHYYSPLPDKAVAIEIADQLREANVRPLPAIGFDPANNAAWFDRLAALAEHIPYRQEAPDPSLRYRPDQTMYVLGDAAVLYTTLTLLRPRRVIEVGSGHSSVVMLDAAEREFAPEQRPEFTFIDPFPKRLLSLLRTADRDGCEVLQRPVESVPVERFEELGSGDVLFVDSSHVARIGNDVCFLMFEVLPRLRPGVYVHIHDIFWPFDYPAKWYRMGRAWNEAYLVRAFLMYNRAFEIVFFNDAFARQFPQRTSEISWNRPGHLGSGLWLRKVAD